MTEFGDKIDGLTHYRRGWDAMMRLGAGLQGAAAAEVLTEVADFGANPGQLRMLAYLPEHLPRSAPLVVNLHGCLQTASAYAVGAGWPALAEQAGFALLCPEQQRGNNGQMCFNWFQPGDVTRGQGEVASIRAMIEHMIAAHGLDRKRVFITGLSAGGAMTAAMLATYPEVFSAGAIIAGLPFGTAASVQEALESMMKGRAHSPEAWAALVRAAAPAGARVPRLSVWHGGADSTVAPVNGEAIVAQYRALLGLPETPSLEETIDGARHRVWRQGRGPALLESYALPGLGHGTPIAPNAADVAQRCGVAGPFVLDAGIASTLLIARFWGLLPQAARAQNTPAPEPAAAPLPRLDELLTAKVAPIEALHLVGRKLDPGPLIERALRAAGLMKGRR